MRIIMSLFPLLPSPIARKYFIGGNWKCNGTLAFAKELVEGTLNKVEYNHDKIEVAVAPVAVHLSLIQSMLAPHIIVSA